MDFIDHLSFNQLPDRPAFVREFPSSSSGLVEPIPLHRHNNLGPSQYVVWTLEGQKMTAKTKTVASHDEIVPMFWMKNKENAIIAYEFVDSETANILEIDPSLYNEEAIKVLNTGDIPDGFGVFGLWKAYANYLCPKLSSEMLDENEKALRLLATTEEMRELSAQYLLEEAPPPPLGCSGFSLDGYEGDLTFVEIEMDEEVVLMLARKDFFDELATELPHFPLLVIGGWMGCGAGTEQKGD